MRSIAIKEIKDLPRTWAFESILVEQSVIQPGACNFDNISRQHIDKIRQERYVLAQAR